jgi:hypothetical protein
MEEFSKEEYLSWLLEQTPSHAINNIIGDLRGAIGLIIMTSSVMLDNDSLRQNDEVTSKGFFTVNKASHKTLDILETFSKYNEIKNRNG